MKGHPRPEELLNFPCDHVFKAFGPNDGTESFVAEVRSAVAQEVPISESAITVRPSSKGAYLCVSVVVRVGTFEQLSRIYASLRQVEGLKYLL